MRDTRSVLEEAICCAAFSVVSDARRDFKWLRTKSRLSIMARESREVSDPMEIRLLMSSSVAGVSSVMDRSRLDERLSVELTDPVLGLNVNAVVSVVRRAAA